LGPIALDAVSGRLFVGDLAQGSIYWVKVSNHHLSKPLVWLGEPAALAFDRASRKLFIADAAKKCVWQVDVNAMQPKPVRVSSGLKLREPRGIAVSAGPTV